MSNPNNWPADNQAALTAFYGTPIVGDEVERQLVNVILPFAMYYEGKGKAMKAIKFHRKAAPSLTRVLNEIWEHVGHDQAKLDKDGVSCYDGAYNPRYVRGSTTKPSNHAYGAAIDINSVHNAQGSGRGNMPQYVIDAFKREGWRWGGDYKHSKTDPMHFEACYAPDDDAIVIPPPGKKAPLPEFLGGDVQTDILATEFGDESETQEGAYGKMVDPDKPGVALPFHFIGKRQNVLVTRKGKSVVAEIVDVGPHNTKDAYWKTEGGRPAAEAQHKDGTDDEFGRKVTNPAGIDFTPEVFDALGVPGRRGTRSALVNWKFTDAPVASEVASAEPAPAPVKKNGNGGKNVDVEVVQRRLTALGYSEVGLIDGTLDGRLTGAISSFKHDRGIDPPVGVIDDVLKQELEEAEQEGWKRPIAKERSEATEEVVEKKAPEIAPVKQSRFMAFMAAIGTGVTAAVSAMGDYFKDGLSYIVQAKDYLNLIPGFVWLLGIAGVFIYFWWKSKQGAEGIVDSFRKGERN